MTALGIGIIGAGALLIVCGVKDLDPRAVTLALFTGDPIPAKGDPYTSPGTATPTTAVGRIGSAVRGAGGAIGGAVGGR